MSRGVIYIVWGERAEDALHRSVAWLKKVHPELTHEVVRLPAGTDQFKGLLEKARMMALSPFDETLFLDSDTMVLDRVDYGFDQAMRFGLACCICECPWARRYRGLAKDDTVEYNTGVLFFTRAAQEVFDRWQELTPQIDATIDHITWEGKLRTAPFQDQAAFARAVALWERTPFILPLNWNFRPSFYRSFFGPIKIWHAYEDPPPWVTQLAEYYRAPSAIMKYHETTWEWSRR
jgi:alpha-N-acetylglucosamine transferase